ncbi:MAG: hypothetical protein KAX46_10415, partial [Chromatiaceae bacterium]|nr:hypothetical protein [Chromatiaceae bacterium]
MNELCRVFFEIFQEDYIAPDAPDDVTSLIEALAAINTRLDAANLAYAQMESRVTALTLALEAARTFLPSLNETRAQLILDQHSLAVIGLGGTGAYLLDFLVKTPVREIRAYDLDGFHVHNSFRSPGRLNEPELGKPKAEVYHS